MCSDSISPKVLYNNASGTTGNVTLSETAANFKTLVICYVTNDGHFGSSLVYSPNGKRVALSVSYYNATELTYGAYVKTKLVTISGTSISAYNGTNGSGYGAVFGSSDPTAGGGTNYIKITTVIGFK